MQFRSPTSAPISIVLLSGHSAVVGPEWRDLPELFHHDAVRLGCERTDQAPIPAKTQVEAGDESLGRDDGSHEAAYRQALTTMLDRDEEGDFTADALPNTNVVSGLCGFRARKEDVLRVFREMKDEAAAP